ncbi:MAG TPA: YihY/virulence factor BrkB family protein [Miltoncostaeaceae bacterium]|nr:YihY/virulence factor BrkB family protein [Miltoncostaeaceae bacterium]
MASTRTDTDAPPRRRPLVLRAATGMWDLIAGTVIRSQRDQITGLASQFAYNAFIATVPLAIIVISTVALVGGDDAADRITSTYEEQIPPAYQTILRDVLTSAGSNQGRAALFLVLGAVAALYLVSNAISALITGLDRARGVPHRPWLRGKGVALLFALVWSGLMTVVNVVLLLGQTMIGWLTDRYDLSGSTARQLLDLLFPVAVLLLLVMIWVLYRFGPNAPARLGRAYAVGVAVASVGIVGFTQLFSAYLEVFDTFRVYGGLATIVVYLTFLWALGVALLVGAEGNEELRAVMRGRPTRVPRRSRSVDQDER